MTQPAENRRLRFRLLIAVLVMFGFAFAMVPFYEKFCEVTGLNNLLRPDEVSNTQIDTSRTVNVQFDSNINKLPWKFRPLVNAISVHPGALVRVDFEVENTTDVAVTGQAIPAYSPALAAQHFLKLDCFCFRQQTLAPREKRVMPVVFVVAPALPQDVNTITLSYTFFELPNAAQASSGGG